MKKFLNFFKNLFTVNYKYVKLTVKKHGWLSLIYKKDNTAVIENEKVIIDDNLFISQMGEYGDKIPLAFCLRNIFTGKYRIYVNEKFLEQEDALRKAVLWHEKGHRELNHMKSLLDTIRDLQVNSTIIDNVEKEIEADNYAINNIGVETFYKGMHYYWVMGLLPVERKLNIYDRRKTCLI